MRLLALVFAAVVVVGCGDKKGTYTKFDDDVTAQSSEVWRDPSRQELYLRSLRPFRQSHGPASCVGDSEVIRINGRIMQSSLLFRGDLGTGEVLPPERFSSVDALWQEMESRAEFARVEVQRALRDAVLRKKPWWVRRFERDCHDYVDAFLVG